MLKEAPGYFCAFTAATDKLNAHGKAPCWFIDRQGAFLQMQLFAEGTLEDLGEIDVVLQGCGVQPGGQRYRAAYGFVDLGQTDGGVMGGYR